MQRSTNWCWEAEKKNKWMKSCATCAPKMVTVSITPILSRTIETIKIYNCICKPERAWHWKDFSDLQVIFFLRALRNFGTGNWFMYVTYSQLLVTSFASLKLSRARRPLISDGVAPKSQIIFHDENMPWLLFLSVIARVSKKFLRRSFYCHFIITKIPARIWFQSAFILIGPTCADSLQHVQGKRTMMKITDSWLCHKGWFMSKDNLDAISRDCKNQEGTSGVVVGLMHKCCSSAPREWNNHQSTSRYGVCHVFIFISHEWKAM